MPPPVLKRLLGTDSPADLALVGALFAMFLLLDRATRGAAQLTVDDLGRTSLLAASAAHRWWLFLALGAALAATAAWRPGPLLVSWSELEQGRVLRLLTGTVILVLAWQSALYDYNWLAGRTHPLDRLLVVVLAGAALARPAFLVPFVLVVRVVNEQFVLPFATPAGRNIDDLMVMAIVAVAAGHLLYVLTGRNRTAPVVLLISAAVAAHFFVPGRAKLSIGWLGAGDLANLPLSSWTAGWLGHTDGGWARDLSDFYRRFRILVEAGTVLLELGALVAVTHHRLTRWWLPGCIVFHLVTFATTGFWFLPWIVVEVGLFVIFGTRSLRPWIQENATPARGLVAAAAVLGAPVLFHPPGLAWLDAPVSYGLRMEGVAADGTRYHVPASALAPLSHHVAFDRLQLGSTIPASGAYGAVGTRAELDALGGVDDFDQLLEVEAGYGPPELVEPSREFLARFLEYANQPPRARWSWLGPPEHFWTSAPEPSYRFQDPLGELQVFLVRSIHHDGRPEQHREPVLTLRIDDDGQAQVVSSAGP